MPQPYRAAVMTEQGEQLISKALTEECKIEFTRVETGNGTYSEEEKKDTSLRKRTDLKSMKNSYMINDQELIEAENSIKLSMIISNIDPVTKESVVPEAYYLNEIGVYAKEHGTDNEVLFSIAVTAGDRGDLLPEYTEGQSPTEIRQTYKIAIGSTDKVYVNYEPQAYALKNDLESHKNDAIAHMTLDEKKELKRNASQTEAGRMSAADKKKLDGIDAEANKTIIDSGLSETSGNPVENATITKELNKKATSLNLQTHTSSSVTDTEGVHGFKVDTEEKKAYAKINGEWEEIAGGGGGETKTVLNVTTTRFQGKTVTATMDGGETLTKTFSSAGTVQFSLKYVGTYVLSCDGYTMDVVNETLGSVLTVEFNGINIYGFHIDGGLSNPDDMVSYNVQYDGKDVLNKNFTPCYMDFTMNKFEYGSWKTVLDEWLCPRPCLLAQDGTVFRYLNENDYTKDVNGNDVTAYLNGTTGLYNAMCEWGKNGKKIWYKIVPDVGTDESATIYIADYQADSGFVCWSFYDCNNNIADHFYTRIYEGVLKDGKLRSISGSQPTNRNTYANEVSYANAMNTDTSNPIWYTGVTADWILVSLLLIMISKSTNSQAKFGIGNSSSYVDNSASNYNKIASGTMNTKGMFWGSNVSDTSHLNGVKVFGMENLWGNIWERVSGEVLNNTNRMIKLTYGTADGTTVRGYNETGNGYKNIGVTPSGTSGGYVSKMCFNANGIHPKVVSGSETTYYCDGLWFNTSQVNVVLVGGLCAAGSQCGCLCLDLSIVSSLADWIVGASLSCKPLGS